MENNYNKSKSKADSNWVATYSRTVKAVRHLDQRRGSEMTPLSINLGGNCNLSFMTPGLRLALADRGIWADIKEKTYDGWIPDALQKKETTDFWIIWISSLGLSRGGTERRDLNISGIKAGIEAALKRGERVVLIMPESMEIEGPFSEFSRWRRNIIDQLESVLPSDVIRIDPECVHSMLGDNQWFAGRYWTLAKTPCHPDAATMLAKYTAHVISGSIKPKIKAIAVDLDDTLWGGVIGECGSNGVDLEPDGKGRPYLQLQRFLKDLSDSGIAISVVSKNNLEDALEPFSTRSEMILKREDIVHFYASWKNKAESIKQIAMDLNVQIESVCFLDDSKHERAEASALLPDLIVPDLPEDPEARIGFLQNSGLFIQPSFSDEDKQRVEYFRSQVKRKELAEEVGDVGVYLNSLNMRLTATRINSSNISRVTDLIHKTTQFNLTNRRHSEAYLTKITQSEINYAYCFSLSDRFGEAGIIAVVIGLPEKNSLVIDSWVMSCRVINRDVEHAIFEHLCRWKNEASTDTIDGLYVPSSKNKLVAKLYLQLGFELSEETEEGCKYKSQGNFLPSHHLQIHETKCVQ